MMPLMDAYRVLTGPSALREMTIDGYPGARAFAQWHLEKRLTLQTPTPFSIQATVGLKRLGPGERECIALYDDGAGDFLVIDDGPGAAFCRREGIPYVNALLVPRLLDQGSSQVGPEVEADLEKIFRVGRYAPWVMAYALSCPLEDLSFFLPSRAVD